MFFPGIPEPAWAHRFELAFISIARLRRRKGVFAPPVKAWAMDSAAFSEIDLHGGYQNPPQHFAIEAAGWVNRVPGCAFVATQDYMCEPFILAKTGLTVADHQRLTIARYDAIAADWRDLVGTAGPPLLPVLQGFTPEQYVANLRDYGSRIPEGAWVGVGSVCKRQGNIALIRELLTAILEERDDLRLHLFGVKVTALEDALIRELIWSGDSMAWAYAARKQGRNPNDYREALAFVERIERPPVEPHQPSLFKGGRR